jgi:hypothetical protein
LRVKRHADSHITTEKAFARGDSVYNSGKNADEQTSFLLKAEGGLQQARRADWILAPHNDRK